MSQVVVPMFERVLPFLSPSVVVTRAQDRWQLTGSRALRRQVFCAEQGVFEGDDADEHDAGALTIVALSTVAGMHDVVVGTVRIYEEQPGVWYGGRLAVAPEYRRHASVGERLTVAAVATARALGARRFLATVQEANIGFFERQRFALCARVTVYGLPHALMEADMRGCRAADSILPAAAA